MIAMIESFTERLCSLDEFCTLAQAETDDLPRRYELDEGVVLSRCHLQAHCMALCARG
jgi:hypothetical protein